MRVVEIDAKLKYRVDVLLESGEIDADIAQAVIAFAEYIEAQYDILLNEDNGSMLLTHICMALVRIKKGDEILPMDAEVLAQVRDNEVYRQIPNLVRMLERKLNVSIPESEFGYLAVHLINLLG